MVQAVRKLRPSFVILVLLTLAAWAPWLSREAAEARTAEVFSSAWEGIMDGCGLQCAGCRAEGLRKLPFGWQVQLEYACGMIPADTAEYHEQALGFVSLFGTVHGLPLP